MKRLFLVSILVLFACLLPAAAWIHGSGTAPPPPNTIALSNTSIVEMSANGTFLGSASIVGSFTGTPSWSLTDALSVFQINSTTGVVTVANNTNLVNATHPTIPITISVSGTTPSTTPGNFTINVTIAGGPGLALGTYGSTTASGWTTIGPSDGTLASASFTNIIYVSDSMGDDNRDGSVPTFVDDNTTEQFVLSSNASPVAGDVYTSPNGKAFTVAVSNTSVKLVQMTSRTGLPDASGTLTRTSGTGPATMAYTAATPGIHGPVKTLIKGAGGSGPGSYDPNASGTNNGDGTGLGSIGTWYVAGAGNGFALRNGKPDWLLLRMGDTFTNQTIEVAYNSGASDNFGKGGFSEQEPMVIGSYDESVPATSPDLPSGARQRPIIVIPGALDAYAASMGDSHGLAGRGGITIQGGGSTGYIAIMGIEFYSAQRDPASGAYVGPTNVSNSVSAVTFTSGKIGILVEDVRARWAFSGVSNSGTTPYMKDINIRRNQFDHCYTTGGAFSVGLVLDFIEALGGAISPGLTVEENVIDLCGYVGPSLTVGDLHSRNVYLQNTSVFGYRRGNTSVRSASEDFQFRAGGVIDDNFTWAGSNGMDIGHPEGDLALTSSTVVTNNVLMNPQLPFATSPVGLNFLNSNDVTASNNLIAQLDSSVGAFSWYAATDAYEGGVNNLSISNPGSGGVDGDYGCIGGAGTFTGGHGSGTTSTYIMRISGGVWSDWAILEPTGTGDYLVGDVLTPIANFPSINTAGTTLTAAGSGGTPGTYGETFASPFCAFDPVAAGNGIVDGIALTNFSGSMAGSGARARFILDNFTGITRTLNVGTGFYEATATLNTASFSIRVGDTFTVTGATPSAYNGTWTAINGTGGAGGTLLVWSLNTAMDPGVETTPGGMTLYFIVATGAGYQPLDVLTASPGGQTGLRIRVDQVAHLSSWTATVASTTSSGTHGLMFTGNTIFNWPDSPVAPSPGDLGGVNDAPGGVPGSGAANVWTPNIFCVTAQFTGAISLGTVLTTSAVVNGPIVSSTNLAGPGVMANTTIVSGSGSSWVISPSQSNVSAETMYSYTCTPTTVFTHPENTIETYAASLGLTASIDGYMNVASANAKWNWNPAYTANNGINPYIRHGFGMTP